MYRSGFKFIITALFLITFSPAGLAQEKKVRTCVMFFSYSASMVAYQNMLQGFNESFIQPLSGPVSIVTEYLDLGRTNNEAYGRSIIENHKGEIWAENIASGGAEFSFRLMAIKKGKLY